MYGINNNAALIDKANLYNEDDDLLSPHDTGDVQKQLKRRWYAKCAVVSFLILTVMIVFIAVIHDGNVSGNSNQHSYVTSSSTSTSTTATNPKPGPLAPIAPLGGKFTQIKSPMEIFASETSGSSIVDTEMAVMILFTRAYYNDAEDCVNNLVGDLLELGKSKLLYAEKSAVDEMVANIDDDNDNDDDDFDDTDEDFDERANIVNLLDLIDKDELQKELTKFRTLYQFISVNEMEQSLYDIVNNYGDSSLQNNFLKLNFEESMLQNIFKYSNQLDSQSDLTIKQLKITGESDMITIVMLMNWSPNIINAESTGYDSNELAIEISFNYGVCSVTGINQISYKECAQSVCYETTSANSVLMDYLDSL